MSFVWEWAFALSQLFSSICDVVPQLNFKKFFPKHYKNYSEKFWLRWIIILSIKVIFIFNGDSWSYDLLLNNIKFSEALFFFCLWLQQMCTSTVLCFSIKTIKASRLAAIHNYSKEWFCKCWDIITAFVWSKVQTEFDWRILGKSISLTGVADLVEKKKLLRQ